MRSLLLVVILLSVAGAAAQVPPPKNPLDLFPLDVGSQWVYTVTHRDSLDADEEFERYERWTVVADTTVDGYPASVMVQERLAEDLSVQETGRCAYWAELNGSSVLVFSREIEPPCTRPLTALLLDAGIEWLGIGVGVDDCMSSSPWIEVGGDRYEVGCVLGVERGGSVPGEPDTYDGVEFIIAEQFGTSWLRFYRESWANGHEFEDWIYRPQYASVRGRTYGALPTSVEPPKEAPVALVIEGTSPNPFSTSATVALVLPAPEAVKVEAFDALGRRVLARDLGVLTAGRHALPLDGAHLVPGVYVVRVTTASGQAATQRVVRID